jgi:hypothetical protein
MMNTDQRELTDSDIYERQEWGHKMDAKMSMVMFSQGWWSNLMQTVTALGIVAVLGLIISLRSDVAYLMREAPYVTRADYNREIGEMKHEMYQIEHEMSRK